MIRRRTLFGALILATAMIAACRPQPVLLDWEPVGCYSMEMGGSSRFFSERDLQTPFTLDPAAKALRIAVTRNVESVRYWKGDVVFGPDSVNLSSHLTAWKQIDRRVELRIQSIHSLHKWKLVSIRPDTIDGLVGEDVMLAPQVRVQGVRFDCIDTTHVRTPSGLGYQVLRPGDGATATTGLLATIWEITTLLNGTVVFDGYATNTPITFLLGGNQVIKGVDEGVTGMRVGEKRRLRVPP
jgi:FKBP-type peptidyl-prolyl cis-trans isomerase